MIANRFAIALGIVFLLIGVTGFVSPGFLGSHLSMTHNGIHLVSGAVAVGIGLLGSAGAARTFNLGFGTVYGLLGAFGFILGTPGNPMLHGMLGPADNYLLRVLPGVLELGTMDHLIHILAGVAFLVGGMVYRPTFTVTDRRDRARGATV